MAFDAYLYLDGVAGEATKAGFTGWIELESFQWGVSQSVNVGASSGAGAGKVKFDEFQVTKHSDKSTPKLFLACCNGSHYKDAKLYVAKAGGKTPLTYLKYEFNTVFVSKFDIGASTGNNQETPLEQISFVFGKVSVTYTPQKDDGTAGASIVTGWDVKEGTAA